MSAGAGSGPSKAAPKLAKDTKAYKSVVKGKLALKGGPKPTLDKANKRVDKDVEKAVREGAKSGSDVIDTRTKSEREFEEAQIRKEKELVAKVSAKSHRERIEEFNDKLSRLSEHHDIPRVGPG